MAKQSVKRVSSKKEGPEEITHAHTETTETDSEDRPVKRIQD